VDPCSCKVQRTDEPVGTSTLQALLGAGRGVSLNTAVTATRDTLPISYRLYPRRRSVSRETRFDERAPSPDRPGAQRSRYPQPLGNGFYLADYRTEGLVIICVLFGENHSEHVSADCDDR
jgi:hypothetical protein